MRFSLMLIAALLATPSVGLAQESRQGDSLDRDRSGPSIPRDSLTVGAGAAILPSYEGSNDYVVVPVAAVRARFHGITIASRGTQLAVDLISDGATPGWNIQAGPALNVNFNRTGRLIDPQARAVGKRSVAFEVGGQLGISRTGLITSDYDTLGVRVALLHDVSGVHDSYVITPSIDYGTPLSRRAYVGLSFSASIVGDSYARTYFGVDAAASGRSGLAEFTNPKGGLKNLTGTVLFARSLSGDLTGGLTLYAAGSYSRLQGDFARSPLVSDAGSPNQWLGAIGLGYTF